MKEFHSPGINEEPTFGSPVDNMPFEELRAICGPYNCSQVILAEHAEELGISIEEARRLGSTIGGGMWHGSTCGCLLAAIVAAGLLDAPQAVTGLVEWFNAEAGALSCPSLINSPTSCAKCISIGRSLVEMLIDVNGPATPEKAAIGAEAQPAAQPTFTLTSYHGDEPAIIVPEGVTEIAPHAFEGLASLNNVMLPASLRAIGDYAFAGCTGMHNVMFKPGLTSIGAHAFEGCLSLTAAELPSSVTQIGESAFAGCANLAKGDPRAISEARSDREPGHIE